MTKSGPFLNIIIGPDITIIYQNFKQTLIKSKKHAEIDLARGNTIISEVVLRTTENKR